MERDSEAPQGSSGDPYEKFSPRTNTSRALFRVPTRVSKACARCRRQKIRCDSFRPCSLCVRARVSCVATAEGPPSFKWTKPNVRHGRSSSNSVAGVSNRNDFAPMTAENSPNDRSESRENATQSMLERHQSSPVSPSYENLDASPAAMLQDAQSAMDITRKIIKMHGRHVVERTTSAIPDGQHHLTGASRPPNQSTNREVLSILGVSLPSREIMDGLLEEYFDTVHWFSLVIYEPIFRPQYESVANGYAFESQKGFLILLATVLGIASWYRAKSSNSNLYSTNEDWDSWRVKLFAVGEARFLELMDERSLASLQTCLLLGSYHVYHGRPNSSLALLGATIKIAQAMGLHRESVRSGSDNGEERKRIWWTIYTWDRFASITYGRPLGINDADCNVSLPADISECVRSQTANDEGIRICFSTYQTQLSKLYMIASPLIKTIFGLRISTKGRDGFNSRYTSLMEDINQTLTFWRDQLPSHLRFKFDYDVPLDASLEQKVYHRQALSLQLTYDNILIILHRPVLAQQVDSLCKTSPSSAQDIDDAWSAAAASPGISSVQSSQQWWEAAVRISSVTKLPNTARVATDSHLVGFLAIILFNSAIVMVVYALSDPLSDRAQEAKRNLTRIFRLVELLGKRSSLSRQSSVILQDVIQLLLDHEGQAMLGPRGDDEELTNVPSSLAWNQAIAEDALRDPLPVNPQSYPGHSTDIPTNPGLNEVFRLNESLNFVQKAVFPATEFGGSMDTSTLSTTQQDPSEHTNYPDGWLPDNQYGFENGGYDGDFGMVDPGIYWIWEPS